MSSRSLILGTAGHIDHGKSTLIQALTGTDPDRLAEEKARGITIQLGFAQLSLPSGKSMGVVDVPGHEKFVKQMVAGATGVDVALMVIAADDGIMPQTTEHLAVLEMLGVPACVVAITKCDLVDDDWLSFVTGEITEFLEDTPYAGAPVVPVSAVERTGFDALLAAIDAAASEGKTLHETGPFRLPIDRAFTIKGAGTVVTGTLWSGEVSPDDEVELLPSGTRGRVRSIQSHGVSKETALPGNRVALNISGIKPDEVHPGNWVVAPQSVVPTDRFDARISFVGIPHSKKPLKTGARVHIAHGTFEGTGRVLLMNERADLGAGQSCYAQIRLDEPLAVRYNDRFVLRSYSPTTVIGGGRVLIAHPKRRSNLSPDEKRLIGALDEGDRATSIHSILAITARPMTLADITKLSDLDSADIALCLDTPNIRALPYKQQTFYCEEKALRKWLSAVENALMSFHYANPRSTGMSLGALQHACKHHIDDDAFGALVQVAADKGVLCVNGGEVSHTKAGAGARMLEEKTAGEIERLLKQAGPTPPLTAQLPELLALDKAACSAALAHLCSEKRAVRINESLYYDSGTYDGLKQILISYIEKNGASNAADLKDAMALSRKYAIPLLEHFDAAGITRRVGDLRELAH